MRFADQVKLQREAMASLFALVDTPRPEREERLVNPYVYRIHYALLLRGLVHTNENPDGVRVSECGDRVALRDPWHEGVYDPAKLLDAIRKIPTLRAGARFYACLPPAKKGQTQ